MQFVENGPDIPERLLQEHEDGRVIFFCGAGISYPAGLPGFGGLVDKIYEELGTTRSTIEDEAYGKGQYDATLDLLERRVPGQREAVRAALQKVLKPNLRKKGAKDTHNALLQLSRDRNNNVRLVTTNFDRIFQLLMDKVKSAIPGYPAPLLPIPKNSRWNGVVYLHGLLPKKSDQSALNRLVLSSGDFGLAYLTERWASRFVSELFRNYIVCFVGYSINDPVLRYMMDALAADRMLGELTPQAYAFGDYTTVQYDRKKIEWEAKGVTPILYEVPDGTHDHSALHKTLKLWAETHRDGVLGKERIVAQYAVNPPMASTEQDNYVGRILWAVSHKSSLPARRFANLNPVPPIEWLEPLSQQKFNQTDLPRFGVPPMMELDDKLNFSLAWRPTPYTLAPKMALVNSGISDNKWDDVMFELANWLIRHLDNPKLVIWIAKHGGQLHQQFSWLITRKIEELDRLIKEGKQDEIDRIIAGSPKAIPGQLMRTLWRLLLSGRVKSYVSIADIYSWRDKFEQDGLTPTIRLELRDILSPRVELSEPYRFDSDETKYINPKRISDIVRWEVVLSTAHPHSALSDMQNKKLWNDVLPELLQDFSVLLKDALDLKRELGGADSHNDGSYSDQPSISEHSQNKDFHDWTILIELARDAWLSSSATNVTQAVHTAEVWWDTPYPTFKRLALFAAAQDNVIPNKTAIKWLLSEESWWLWSEEARREVMRLLTSLATKLDKTQLKHIEQAILRGPPRKMYVDDIDSERWEYIVQHGIWLRLEKLKVAGGDLSKQSLVKLNAYKKHNPSWLIASDERDEFPMWMESGWGDDLDNKALVSPRQRKELVIWLKQDRKYDHWNRDDWRQRCSINFSTTACALYELTLEDYWPVDRWRDALQAWAEDKHVRRSWRYMAPVIATAPDILIEKCAHGISWWLQAIAKTFEGHEDVFYGLIHKLMALNEEGELSIDDPVGKAINHPIGHATEAMLRLWYRQPLQDGQGLPETHKVIFTTLCDKEVAKFSHGRVLLAANAISLFRVDKDWATDNLLPLFDWEQSEAEAKFAWEGFLWSPRLYLPLLAAIKKPLLDTASHYSKLGNHVRQYADFLTFAALEPNDIFTAEEFKVATSKLPQEGLNYAAQALVRALGSSGDKRSEYWHNRVLPYLKHIWPKSIELISPSISESLARLCVLADDAFPSAILNLKNWITPVEHSDYVVHLVCQSKLAERFPEDILDLLNRIINGNVLWHSSELNDCLQTIQNMSLVLKTDPRFIRLLEIVSRHSRT